MDKERAACHDLSDCMFDDWVDLDSILNENNVGTNTENGQNKAAPNVNHSVANVSSNCLEISALCCDEEVSGFDKNAGASWIYPTNYSMRDYQFNIVKAALFKNTLVSLPTGLGKTFIAAVVMYNYYRWYPMGKIVFTAPTRPLVAQQIEACYHIMAIPPEDTIEMTGSMQTAARVVAWQQKRVFFATPQVVHNDLESGACPAQLLRCLVVDEAHRARGRHAYCQLLQSLASRQCSLFRVLALSATPGSKVEDVINVVKNLQIAHLELRSESCIDVAMYSHSRKIQTIVVPLGEELTKIRQKYIEILDGYTRRLTQYRVLNGNIGGLSKGRIIMLFKEYQHREKAQRHPQHQIIMKDFTMVITLYHALELLTKHGTRVFLNFFDEHTDKTWVGKDDRLTGFLEGLRDDLGINPFTIDTSTLPDGTVPEIQGDLKYGHPKFDHLRKTMLDHFAEAKIRGQETKAIVFCEYRESVNLVHCLLLQCRPNIRPHMFIGQGLGAASGAGKESGIKALSQKQQLRIMQLFRQGSCNVLVSTCVGEEGLDVGSVDLIICFDISSRSPIRLVQRCGRTGRERGGKVVILVTEGKEHQTLRECIMQRDSLNKRVLQSKELLKNLYTASPRMFPSNVVPECQKMFIKVDKKVVAEKPEKPSKGQAKIKDMFKKRSLGSDNDFLPIESRGPHLSKNDFLQMYPNGIPTFNFFKKPAENWCLRKDNILNTEDTLDAKPALNLSEWTEWQRNLQYSVKIGHSSDSRMLSEVLQYADNKRFDVSSVHPEQDFVSQVVPRLTPEKVSKKSSPLKKKQQQSVAPKKKPINIRDMFLKMAKSNNEEHILYEAKLKETLRDCGIQSDEKTVIDGALENEKIPTVLLDLMVEFNIEKSKLAMNPEVFKYDYTFFDKRNKISENRDLAVRLKKLQLPQNIHCLENKKMMKTVHYLDLLTSPKRLSTLKQPFPIQCMENKSVSNDEKLNNTFAFIGDNKKQIDVMNFDLGDIDDIFGDSFTPVQKNISKNNCYVEAKVEIKSVENPLDFFGLESIEDMFVDDTMVTPKLEGVFNTENDKTKPRKPKNDCEKSKLKIESHMKSPVLCSQKIRKSSKDASIDGSILTAKLDNHNEKNDDPSENDAPTSPILCSQRKVRKTKKIVPFDTPKDATWQNDDKIEETAASPILYSQTKRTSKLSTSKPTCSTPIILDAAINKNLFINNFNKNKNKTLHSRLIDLSNISKIDFLTKFQDEANNVNENVENTKPNESSMFSVTQIIDLINKDCVKSTQEEVKKEVEDVEAVASDDSSHSVILCSQKPPSKPHIKIPTQKKQNITVLESTDSDEDEEELVNPTLLVKNASGGDSQNSKACKRKLELSDEFNECSPFFKKVATDTNKCSFLEKSFVKYKVTLKEKLSSVLKSCSGTKENVNESFTFAVDPEKCWDGTDTESDIEEELLKFKSLESVRVNNLSQLGKFAMKAKKSCLERDDRIGVCEEERVGSERGRPHSLSTSDEEFKKKPMQTRLKEVVRVKKKKKKRICEFIDYEAVLSDDTNVTSSGENDSEDLDTSIAEFLCDEEHVPQEVDMQAKYLQSVRSPVKQFGKFKIPEMPRRHVNVLSQVDDHDNDVTYEFDSFCVGPDEGLTQQVDYSELEIAEALLKKRKRSRKRKETHMSPTQRIKVPADNPAGESPIALNRKKKLCLQIKSDSDTSTDDDIFS